MILLKDILLKDILLVNTPACGSTEDLTEEQSFGKLYHLLSFCHSLTLLFFMFFLHSFFPFGLLGQSVQLSEYLINTLKPGHAIA